MLGFQPVPTVRIKSDHPDHEGGFVIINQSDFDQSIHKLWGEPATKAFDPVEPYPVAASIRGAKINMRKTRPALTPSPPPENQIGNDADS